LQGELRHSPPQFVLPALGCREILVTRCRSMGLEPNLSQFAVLRTDWGRIWLIRLHCSAMVAVPRSSMLRVGVLTPCVR
jgi:hypothetical protein